MRLSFDVGGYGGTELPQRLSFCETPAMYRPLRLVAIVLVVFFLLPALGAERIPDQQITRLLQQAFKRDSRLKTSEIHVATQNGTVTLRGKVGSILEKHTAEQVAKRTTGVRLVINMLQVELTVARDDEIAANIRRRLSQSGFLRQSNLRVDVAHGVVTLSGTLPSWTHSLQAQKIAREVRGVRLVRSNLEAGGASFGAESTRTDDQIKTDLESALDRDAYLAELPIEVTVESGAVRLDGDVPNLFHRELAEVQAKQINHARAVDNRLVVVSQMVLETLPDLPTDEELEDSVLDELRADPRTAGGEIQASAAAGNLILHGSVMSMFERQTAERTARQVFGVARVENRLVVDAMGQTDDEIHDDIHFNLSSDTLLAEQPLVVQVEDGSVTVSGQVSDFAARLHATNLIARVRGVRSIVNEIEVRRADALSDEVIRARIVDRLSSNGITSRIASRLQVRVEAGHVSLTGKVDLSSELVEAERIARLTDGVRTVSNAVTLDR